MADLQVMLNAAYDAYDAVKKENNVLHQQVKMLTQALEEATKEKPEKVTTPTKKKAVKK